MNEYDKEQGANISDDEMNLSADAVHRKTKAILGKDIDYSYITEETIAADAALGTDAEASSTAAILYGNNARYGTKVINGVRYQVYYFDTKGSCSKLADSCGSDYVCFARMDLWHHTYIDTCPNGRERWSFSQ